MIARPQHIGIVTCSAEGAALCYRTICAEGARLLGPHAHPEISMHTPSLADYVKCLERGDLRGVGALMLSSANKLAASGADFLICPDNTIHQAMTNFRDIETLQKFAAVHASIHNHFNLDRHLNRRDIFKQNRSAALAEWRQLAA